MRDVKINVTMIGQTVSHYHQFRRIYGQVGSMLGLCLLFAIASFSIAFVADARSVLAG